MPDSFLQELFASDTVVCTFLSVSTSKFTCERAQKLSPFPANGTHSFLTPILAPKEPDYLDLLYLNFPLRKRKLMVESQLGKLG